MRRKRYLRKARNSIQSARDQLQALGEKHLQRPRRERRKAKRPLRQALKATDATEKRLRGYERAGLLKRRKARRRLEKAHQSLHQRLESLTD